MSLIEELEPHDSHVQLARKTFRDCGFDLMAMQFKRCPEALQALRDFNRAPASWKHPFAWSYHPNKWCAENWRGTLGIAALRARETTNGTT